jgi:drug/metabolite transporter (DMT)-like permease
MATVPKKPNAVFNSEIPMPQKQSAHLPAPHVPDFHLQRLAREPKSPALFWKTAIVGALVVGSNVLGSYSLTRGLHQVGGVVSWSPAPYIHAFAQPWVCAGVLFTIAWLVFRLALLSWADLSYVLPVTAVSYVLSAVTGVEYLNERVEKLHWAGICLIALGAALVAVTPPESSGPGGQP